MRQLKYAIITVHLQFIILSELGCDLYDDGYANITNIDLSSVVISAMNQRCADTREHMECIHYDASIYTSLSESLQLR